MGIPPSLRFCYREPATDDDSKYKIPRCQNGSAYLTSHRICYVDLEEPRGCSVGIDLKDVDRVEFQVASLAQQAGSRRIDVWIGC